MALRLDVRRNVLRLLREHHDTEAAERMVAAILSLGDDFRPDASAAVDEELGLFVLTLPPYEFLYRVDYEKSVVVVYGYQVVPTT